MRQRIESLIDDKMRYAAERCVQEMCKGEPYSLFNYGDVQQLEAEISPEGLHAEFHEMLRAQPSSRFSSSVT